jgi:hypothetical protein
MFGTSLPAWELLLFSLAFEWDSFANSPLSIARFAIYGDQDDDAKAEAQQGQDDDPIRAAPAR